MNNEYKTEVVARTKAMLIRKIEEAGAKEAFDVWRKMEALEREAEALEREIDILKELTPKLQEGNMARSILDALIEQVLDDDTGFVLH